MEKILVATDGSECSQRAVSVARNMAECMSSKVKIINVIPRERSSLALNATSKADVDRIRNELELQKEHYELLSQTILDEALKIFQGFEGEVTTKKITGEPALEIIKEAEEGNYDLIIMGCRSQGFFSKMIGSTTNKVLNNTEKSVLTV